MNALAWERWYPALLGVVVLAAWAALGCPFPAPDAARDLFAATLSLASITVGFLATAMSIVASSPDSSLLRQLKSSGYMQDLFRYMQEPFVGAIALAAVCLLGFFMKPDSPGVWALHGAWALLVGHTLAAVYRMGSVFVSFLQAASRSASATSPRSKPL